MTWFSRETYQPLSELALMGLQSPKPHRVVPNMRLAVSPTTDIPMALYSQRFWGFIFLCWNPGLFSLCLLPSCSSWFIRTWIWDHLAYWLPPHLPVLPSTSLSSPPQLPISAPPTSLGECFFFNSLVIGLPYNLISGSLGCVLFLSLLLSFFWLYKEAKHIYLHLHLGQKSCNWALIVAGAFFFRSFPHAGWVSLLPSCFVRCCTGAATKPHSPGNKPIPIKITPTHHYAIINSKWASINKGVKSVKILILL